MKRPTLANRTRRIGVALICAIALTLASVQLERTGPQQAQYGNLCGAHAADPCYKSVLKGGFPLAYLFDAPGVSVERQLAFIEDQVSVGALVLDIAIYFAIVLLAVSLATRRSTR